jgi:hypothetical protein
MESMFDFSDMRCVKCGKNDLLEFSEDGIVCQGCNYSYDFIDGIPFFGEFELDNILGLIEVTANADTPHSTSEDDLLNLEKIIVSYYHAQDQKAFLDSVDKDLRPYIPRRYNEYLEFTTLTQGVDLKGEKY